VEFSRRNVLKFGTAAAITTAGLVVTGTSEATQMPFNNGIWKLQGFDSTGKTYKETYPIGTYTDNWYQQQPDGSVTLKAPVQGAHTSGSSFARCELREMNSHGTKAAWATNVGTHQMDSGIMVLKAPAARPRIIVGQIHTASEAFIIVFWDNGVLGWTLNSAGQGSIGKVALNTRFTLRLLVTGNNVKILINGVQKVNRKVSTRSTCYFKTGCYLQTATGTDYGQVDINSLSVSHT
jgi:hypothetical protein